MHRRRALRILLFSLLFLSVGATVLFAVLWIVIPLPLEDVKIHDASPAFYDARGRLFHLRLSRDSEWFIPVSLSDMGRWLPVVAVGVEDRRFYSHPGVDVLALLRAAAQNLTSRRVISGASTISSQAIRLSLSERFRETQDGPMKRRRRNIATKTREFIQAMKLERALNKDEILELYLNRAPFGGNIRGVQAAGLIYFGKPASNLSPGEACLLIGMLKGPTLYRPDKHPQAARKRRDFIIRSLEKRGIFTRDEARRALLEELPSHWNSPPMRAFHFAEMLLSRFPVFPPGEKQEIQGKVETTLDLEMQTKLEAILSRAVASFPENITAAGGVADNKTGKLIAWAGNARFGQGGRNAWVDCGRAPRSPGSTLKPFAFMAAFDSGLLTPSSLLADSPLAFSGRAPRNFDLTYRGAVSARVALSDSLNAPAARVLRMAGPENVLRLMRHAGLHDLKERADFYGDSLILGGCEVTLFQLLEAYTAVASGGLYRPLALLENDQVATPARIASAEAAWMISDILDNRGRLSSLTREALGGWWHAALKTGTSYGLRDAWTAAWTPDATVVVWVGDPTGTPWAGLVGASAAAPTAVSILRAVSPKSRWYTPPPQLELREVCSLSGQPPTAACLSTRFDRAIQGVSRSVPCGIHSVRDGKSALLWPAEMAARETPPALIRKAPEIKITSPIAEATYYKAPLATGQKIPLRAEGAVDRVWWYLKGRCIGTAIAGETFFYSFPGGRHHIAAADAAGRTATTVLTVISPQSGKGGELPSLLP